MRISDWSSDVCSSDLVDDDGIDAAAAEPVLLQFAVDRGKRIVERVHEDAAHHLHHQHLAATGHGEYRGAPARRALGVIQRPQQPGVAVDVAQRLALVPGMVAENDGVDAGGVEVIAALVGEAEDGGGMLAVTTTKTRAKP